MIRMSNQYSQKKETEIVVTYLRSSAGTRNTQSKRSATTDMGVIALAEKLDHTRHLTRVLE